MEVFKSLNQVGRLWLRQCKSKGEHGIQRQMFGVTKDGKLHPFTKPSSCILHNKKNLKYRKDCVGILHNKKNHFMFNFFDGTIFLLGDVMKVMTVRELQEKKEVKLQKGSPTKSTKQRWTLHFERDRFLQPAAVCDSFSFDDDGGTGGTGTDTDATDGESGGTGGVHDRDDDDGTDDDGTDDDRTDDDGIDDNKTDDDGTEIGGPRDDDIAHGDLPTPPKPSGKYPPSPKSTQTPTKSFPAFPGWRHLPPTTYQRIRTRMDLNSYVYIWLRNNMEDERASDAEKILYRQLLVRYG